MWQENTASDILYVCDPKHPKYLLVFESTMPLPMVFKTMFSYQNPIPAEDIGTSTYLS